MGLLCGEGGGGGVEAWLSYVREFDLCACACTVGIGFVQSCIVLYVLETRMPSR